MEYRVIYETISGEKRKAYFTSYPEAISFCYDILENLENITRWSLSKVIESSGRW